MSDSERPETSTGRPPLASELELMVPDVDGTPSDSTVFLVGLSGRQAGKLFKVREGETILGRSSRSLVAFDEKAVSHHHARLTHVAGRCVLTDLGSTNGTFVNDVRLAVPVELHAGDVVRIGRTTLGFLTDAADEQQHTRALARAGTGPVPFHATGAIIPAGTAALRPMVVAEDVPAPNGLDLALDKVATIWGLARRYGRLIVAGAVLGAAVGGATILVKPPKAIAEFRLFLKHQGQENVHGRFAVADAEYFRFPVESFTSVELVRATMEELGMAIPSPGSVLATKTNVVLTVEGPGIYKGQFFDTSPEFAEKFLATHLHGFLEREISKAIKVQASEVQLLRKQYEENERQLRETEDKLRAFKEQHLSGLPEHAVSQLQSRATLQGRVVELQANLERYTQELALSRKQYASGDALVARKVDRSEPYAAGIAAVRQKLAAARARGLTDLHPEVKALVQEEKSLVELQGRAVSTEDTETDRRANRELSALADRVGQLEVLASSTQKELGLVQGRLGELDKIASTLPAVEATYSELTRSLTAGQALHQHLHEQLKAKELKLDFDRASVAGRYEILDAPSAPPVSRTKTAAQRAGVGVALGLVLAIAAAALHMLLRYANGRPRRPAREG